jgi:ABC-type dipeptide/oligopeptide/nickel transport system ATPase subunit
VSVLELCQVTKEYSLRARRFRAKKVTKAVNQVNMTLNKGECLGLVGESGSGKSTLAKLIIGVEKVTSGCILLHGQDISQLKDLSIFRRIQLVMQDSASSLHPKMSVKEIIAEPLQNFSKSPKNEEEEKCIELLELVGLDYTFMARYPHQLSGGQKQRVCIAKALAVKPEIIIFDESVASLDKTSQTSIINTLKLIKNKEQISYLFITHDLQSTKAFCDRIAVIYQGGIIETLTDWEGHLQHPYTHSLFQALR